MEFIKIRLAVFTLAFYLLFVIYLIIEAKEKENQIEWTRLVFLLAGIEAIVFTAIGYVFGRDTSRKAEVNAKNNEAEALQKKNEAERKKEEVTKKEQLAKNQLARLQEAVITEHSLLGNTEGVNYEIFNVKSEKKDKKIKSRALTIALEEQENFRQLTEISFDYKVNVDDFQSITIDGETKYSSEGYFSSVYVYGKRVEVEIDRDNFKSWEFTATNIIDENGKEMVMSNAPLISNGNKSSFKIEYK